MIDKAIMPASAALLRCALLLPAGLVLAACAQPEPPVTSLSLASTGEGLGQDSALARAVAPNHEPEDETQKLSPRLVTLGEPVPKGGGVRKIGDPYVAAGQTVVPQEDPDYDQAGVASWYGEMFHGRKTANGEIYDMNALTAAHPTLPLPSYVKVTHLGNGRSLILRVNDRGPFKRNRIIDLSRRAAQLLGVKRNGTGPVRVQYLRSAPLDGDDSFEQAYLWTQPWYAENPTRLGAADAQLQPASSRVKRPADG